MFSVRQILITREDFTKLGQQQRVLLPAELVEIGGAAKLLWAGTHHLCGSEPTTFKLRLKIPFAAARF